MDSVVVAVMLVFPLLRLKCWVSNEGLTIHYTQNNKWLYLLNIWHNAIAAIFFLYGGIMRTMIKNMCTEIIRHVNIIYIEMVAVLFVYFNKCVDSRRTQQCCEYI